MLTMRSLAHAEGKYFDCEASEAKSSGQMLNVIAEASTQFQQIMTHNPVHGPEADACIPLVLSK